MYRIMVVKSKKDNYASLYQYLTTTIDGVISPVELASKESLDSKIESMLNDEGYAKSDFIVVEVIDYSIDATSYSDDVEADTSAGTDDSDESNSTGE